MTLSIRYFVEAGSTRPHRRLIPTSNSPTKISLRLGQMMVRNVRRILTSETCFFLLGLVGEDTGKQSTTAARAAQTHSQWQRIYRCNRGRNPPTTLPAP